MDKHEEEFLKRLLVTFAVEAEEHIQTISSGLIELEKAPAAERQKEIVELIYREAHSLKGAARSVNLTDIEEICQSLEGCFSAMKRGEISTPPEAFDLFYNAVDLISGLVNVPDKLPLPAEVSSMLRLKQSLENLSKGTLPQKEKQPEAKQEEITKHAETEKFVPAPSVESHTVTVKPARTKTAEHESLHNPSTARPRPPASNPQPGQTPQPPAAHKQPQEETVRISASKLDALLRQAEELISVKLTLRQHADEIRDISGIMTQWRKKRVETVSGRQRMECLIETGGNGNFHETPGRLKEFTEWNSNFAKSIEDRLSGLRKSVDDDSRSIGGMVDNLLEDMKEVLMLPLSTLLELFPKIVRDISHEQEKEVEFSINGGDIEIDKRILQEIKDPLIHIVRNSVDHGIEAPEERKMKNKPPRAKLSISISHKDSGKVEILVKDDGDGIDAERVKAAAIKNGVISRDVADGLGVSEITNLIFRSGISTSQIITTLSGRGLGLAIVREKVEKLGGSVFVETQKNEGTEFHILLPLTLATFRGIIIEAGGSVFAIPTIHIQRVAKIRKEALGSAEGRAAVRLNDRMVSFVRLEDVLELSDKKVKGKEPGFITVLLLGAGGREIAFGIDEVIKEDDMLVKNLGRQLPRVRNIAGATVLGNGKVVLILNAGDLLKSAVKTATTGGFIPAATEKKDETRKRSILVVEDSITSRTLLKNILEASGYNVKTAVDGVDAFTILQTEDFDLVATDVEMPRMNGFELTEKIRADEKLAKIPVVLVTSLQSPADKKRGIDVGANAYIVKSSFDQSNLLNILERLI